MEPVCSLDAIAVQFIGSYLLKTTTRPRLIKLLCRQRESFMEKKIFTCFLLFSSVNELLMYLNILIFHHILEKFFDLQKKRQLSLIILLFNFKFKINFSSELITKSKELDKRSLNMRHKILSLSIYKYVPMGICKRYICIDFYFF